MAFDNLKKIFESSRHNQDSFVPEPLSDSMYRAKRSLIETRKMSNWLISPQGASFVLEQQGKALTEPKLETSRTVSFNRKRLFNPAKFLSNYVSPWFHTSSHGSVKDYSYEQVQKDKKQHDSNVSDGSKYQNRLVKLSYELGKIHDITKRPDELSGVIKLLSGPAGPDSVYGVGSTTIRKATGGQPLPRFVELKNTYELFVGFTDEDNYTSQEKYKQEQWSNQNLNRSEPGIYTEQIEESGSRLPRKTDVYETENPGYKGSGVRFSSHDTKLYNTYKDISDIQERDDNIKTFEKGAVPGTSIYAEDDFARIYPDMASDNERYFQKWNAVDRVGIPDRGSVSGMNRNDVFYANDDTPNSTGLHGKYNDFVKFRFENDSTGGTIQFRNTMTSFTPKFEPEWNEIEYVGRPDPLYIYQGMKRSLSFNFMITIQSRNEYTVAWQKINNLIQKTSPVIDEFGLMSSPVVFITIGSMYKNTPAVLTAVDPEIDDNYPWDIITETPMYISFGISMNIIGNQTPSSETIPFNVPMNY